MFDYCDIWHARLGHTNSMYVFKLQRLGLINMHDNQTKKCDVCIESKLTKIPCPFVQYETNFIGLIHYDLVDLK